MKNWISPNGKWEIHKDDWCNDLTVAITNRVGLSTTYASVDILGNVICQFENLIPKYIKKQVKEMLNPVK